MNKVWKIWWVSLFAVVMFSVAAVAFAASVPSILNYQGTLTDGSGTPLTGSQTITFRLHPEAASAVENSFWSETQTVILDDNGNFSVTLGADESGNLINKDDFDGETYIGIKIGADLELMPRQQLTSVAYAMKAADTNPIGTILEYAGSSAPSGYLMCDGSAVSREDYSALFAIIDTTFGVGDTSTTFNLPDKRNRTSFGAGDTYTLGEKFGTSTKIITTANIPSHSHSVNPPSTNTYSQSSDHNHETTIPRTNDDNESSSSRGYLFNGDDGSTSHSGLTAKRSGNNRSSHHHTVNIASFNSGNTGSGTALDVVNPGLATNFIVKY